MALAAFNDIEHVVEADRANVWHHLAQHKKFETIDPLIIVEGRGMRVWNAAGREHVDAVSGGPCEGDQVSESVLYGGASCFERGPDVFERAEAIDAARAVTFNRQPAVELTITPAFRRFIVDQFAPGSVAIERGIVIAVEVDGGVVTAPLLTRPSASEDRLVLAGGLSVESATDLARVLGGG